MKKVAIYARTSSSGDKQDATKQVDILKDYCKQRGFEVYKTYIDKKSGATEDRFAYQRLLDDVRKRKVSCVCVFKFDRFSRSVKTLVSTLEEFQSLNVEFISYTENIDTSTPAGKALFGICSIFSQMERELCRERIIHSLKIAKERGVVLGRKKKPFDTALAIKLSQEGMGVRKIANRVDVSYGTVYRYLKSVTKTLSVKTA